MTKYALLDFDGFICKAWFASKSKYKQNDDPSVILRKLVREAINKATKHFNDEVTTYLFVSGHTYKKDLYPSYKATREKDEDMKAFRDAMIEEYSAIKSEQLEADDLISICIGSMNRETDDYITFSDDKDLRDISENVCKINVTSEVEELGLDGVHVTLLCRLLAGDKEDNVTGIPKVGMTTALKLIDTFPSIRNIFEIYKRKGISLDEALKQVTLIAPIMREWNEYPADIFYTGESILDGCGLDESIITEIIIGQVTFLSKLATGVYLDENKKD